MSLLVRAIAILFAGMAAGASFAHAAALWNADAVALASFLEVHRLQAASRTALSWTLDLGALLLAADCTIRLVGRPPAQRATGVGVIGLLIALLFGLLVVQPDAAAIAQWAVAVAPSNAPDALGSLAGKYLVRGLLECMAAVAIAISLSLDRPVRKRYGPLVVEDTPGFERRPSIIVPGE